MKATGGLTAKTYRIPIVITKAFEVVETVSGESKSQPLPSYLGICDYSVKLCLISTFSTLRK